MKINAVQQALSQQRADAWIVFTFDRKAVMPAAAGAMDRRLQKMLSGWIQTTGFRGRPNEVTAFPSWESLPAKFVLLAGLGPRRDFHPGRLQRAAASAFREAARLDLRHIAISLAPADGPLPFSDSDLARALVAALYSGQYDFVQFFSSKGRRRAAPLGSLTLAGTRHPAAVRAAIREATLTGEILSEVRNLANLPGNEAPRR